MDRKNEDIQLGARIKAYRIEKGLTQNEFADAVGATSSAVRNWEKGRNKPNKERLRNIADFLGITVNELLYGSSENYIKEVLENDIEEGSRFFQAVIEYKTHTSDLYGIEGAVFFDDAGKPLPIEESPKVEFEIKQHVALEFLENNLNSIIQHVVNLSSKNLDEHKIIDAAIHFVNLQYMYDMQKFEGQYYTYKKTMNDIVPSFGGDINIENSKQVFMEAFELSEKEAYEKAVDGYYQNKLSKHVNDFRDKIDKLYLEYKDKMADYKEEN